MRKKWSVKKTMTIIKSFIDILSLLMVTESSYGKAYVNNYFRMRRHYILLDVDILSDDFMQTNTLRPR